MALIFLKKIWNGLQMMRKYEIKSPLTGWSINWRNKWIRQRSRRPLFRIIRPGNCFLSFSNLISFFNKPFNSRILKKLQWNYKSQFEITIKKWKNWKMKMKWKWNEKIVQKKFEVIEFHSFFLKHIVRSM